MNKTLLVRVFQPLALPQLPSGALLLLRLISGLAFVYHGWGKIQNPFGWMGDESAVPGIFQFLAALSEFGGGIAWMVGLVTPLASFGMLCTMIVATYMHAVVKGDPFVGHGGSYEPALVYLGISLLFIAMGPGKFSADRYLFGERS